MAPQKEIENAMGRELESDGTGPSGVAIAGLGAIGLPLARALDRGIPGLRLVAASANDRMRAAEKLRGFRTRVQLLALEDLAAAADIVVECAPAAVFDRIAEPAVKAGRTLVVLSAAALLSREGLIAKARERRARIIVPSGAILGLDAIKAVAEGEIKSVTHITRKPPRSLAGAPYLQAQGMSLDGLAAPKLIFKGPVREGARHFPANVNVSAAVSLAGIGPDRTLLEVWADPASDRNTHKVKVEADSARFTMEIESLPSPENPRTGRLTPLSVIATLRGLGAPLQIGT